MELELEGRGPGRGRESRGSMGSRGLRPCDSEGQAHHAPAIEIGGGESKGRAPTRANKGSNKGAHKCVVRGIIKVTCEAADPRAEKQLGAQPHTLQSREQVCLRVWGWVGHGSNAVGWGRVVPSNPRRAGPFGPRSRRLQVQQSFGSQVTFVRNCPSRVPGSSARLVRGRPCKQLPKPAEGEGGRGSPLPRKSL